MTKLRTRSCRVCRKKFMPKVWNQWTCSKRCREKYEKGRVKVGPYKAYRLQEIIPKDCPVRDILKQTERVLALLDKILEHCEKWK